MTSIANLLSLKFVGDISLPSNFNYGTAIFERGGVEFIISGDDHVEAWAGGLDGALKDGSGSRRRVTFTHNERTLEWSCTCNPKTNQTFCKHCVAVALAITNR